MTRWLCSAVIASVLLTLGCTSTTQEYLHATGTPAAVELRATPFYAQTAHHCGPAALATVLNYSGARVTPDALAAQVFIPGRKGALRAELLASARRHGRLAYELEPRVDALLREVAAGRPVLVLQNLNHTSRPVWHYAVIVGFNQSQESLVLRSGLQSRLVMSMPAFDASWRAAGRWASVVLPPGELPAEVDQMRYVRAVTGLEHVQQWEAALQAWSPAHELWPQSLPVLIGLGNAHHALGANNDAARALLSAVQLHPQNADAHNNLAFVMHLLGNNTEALRHAKRAVTLGGPNRAEYEKTLRAVISR